MTREPAADPAGSRLSERQRLLRVQDEELHLRLLDLPLVHHARRKEAEVARAQLVRLAALGTARDTAAEEVERLADVRPGQPRRPQPLDADGDSPVVGEIEQPSRVVDVLALDGYPP